MQWGVRRDARRAVGWVRRGCGEGCGEGCGGRCGGAAGAYARLVEPLPHHVGLVQVADVGGEEVELTAVLSQRREVVVAEEDLVRVRVRVKVRVRVRVTVTVVAEEDHERSLLEVLVELL